MENKVYKALKVEGGILKSVLAGNPLSTSSIGDYIGVIYKEGEISYAPIGQKGLAVFGSLEEAKYWLGINLKSGDTGVIYEATGLGNEGAALLLGRKVYSTRPLELTALEKAQAIFGGEIVTVTETSLKFERTKRQYRLYRKNPGEVGSIWHLYEGTRGRVAMYHSLHYMKMFVTNDAYVEPRPKPKFKVGDRVKVSIWSASEEIKVIDEIFWTGGKHIGCCEHPHRWLYKIGGTNFREKYLTLAPPEPVWRCLVA